MAARLRTVVTIAIRLVSILNRLKKRRTASLCSARAATIPTENQMTKATMPRNDTSWPKTWSNGFSSRLKSIVVSLGALRARATGKRSGGTTSVSSHYSSDATERVPPRKSLARAAGCCAAAARFGAFFDVIDDVADGLQFLRIFVRHFH